MNNFVNFRITGLDGFEKKLAKLERGLRIKGVRAAARKAMNIVRDDARRRARSFDDPETKQAIWKQITTQESRRLGRRFNGIAMRVGVRGGARSSKDKIPPWYWRLKEFGTETMAAEPFMRPALTDNISQVTSTMVTEVNREIDMLIAGN